MFKTTLSVSFMGFLTWAYKSIKPPRPKICGSPDGPPVTAPRIKLSDGRHLAYREYGASKEKAQNKIVFVHGFSGCRHDAAIAASTLSPQTAQDLGGVYIVSFDRPGYGESDPDPNRTAKSLAFDIQELADQLRLGSKFYVVGYSMGGQALWGCLKYIPHRLAGAALLAPVANYWWKGFPTKLANQAYYQQFRRDQWAVSVAHYTPWLTHLWNTQKWFPNSSVIARNPDVLSQQDKQLLLHHGVLKMEMPYLDVPLQQGESESIHRDMNVGFGTWDFSPLVDVENPFPNNEGCVHLWQGDEDLMVPVTLQRYIAERLPWIHYQEIPGAGHFFPYADGMTDAIFKALLTRDAK